MDTPCRKMLNEFRSQVVRATLNRHWRVLWGAVESAHETLHICSEDEDKELVTADVMIKLGKLLTGYIMADMQLYGEYLVKAIFYKTTLEEAFEEVKQLITKDYKGDLDVEEIKNVSLKLLSAIHNYITSPY